MQGQGQGSESNEQPSWATFPQIFTDLQQHAWHQPRPTSISHGRKKKRSVKQGFAKEEMLETGLRENTQINRQRCQKGQMANTRRENGKEGREGYEKVLCLVPRTAVELGV